MSSLIAQFDGGALPPLPPDPRRGLILRKPRDGKHYDCNCARCGGDTEWIECWNCFGEGTDGHDCGEDCCCAFPEDNVRCDWCRGQGGELECGNSSQWCEANPLPDREEIKRGELEWYEVNQEGRPV